MQMKSFLISPPVQEAMDRQTKPEPIAVIITLNESKTDPAGGVEPSRARVKEILDSHKIPFRESQFYVFASLTPDVIYELGNEKNSVYQIWRDEKCTTHILSSADTLK